MSLTADLVNDFVEVTTNETEIKHETTVYGTIREQGGSVYVMIDGSNLLTPVSTTATVKDGDRVTVMIKNHTATVTGNLKSPSASSDDLDDTNKMVAKMDGKISEFGEIVANSVSVDQLNAEKGRIDELIATNVLIKNQLTADEAKIVSLEAKDVEITGRLDVNEVNVSKLQTEKLDATYADIIAANINDLKTINAVINNLNATYATIARLEADKAEIDELYAKKVFVTNALLEYAKIETLEALDAQIKNLDADVADIDNLIFGNAAGDNISTNFANAVIAQLGNAQIKDAMIQNISAGKINGDIITTNEFRVRSEDSKLVIADSTMQISDQNGVVRVQIGKDAAGDYSISVCDAEGNVMFSKGGITDAAIKDAIIRDEMISEDAGIDAGKLDISSLFTVINKDGSPTINASKVFIDGQQQTLEVSFKSMTDSVTEQGETISSQGTQLQEIQGKITSKVWQQDIETSADGLDTKFQNKYSSLELTVSGLSSTVSSNKTELEKSIDDLSEDVNAKISSAESRIEQTEKDITLKVSQKELSDTLEYYYTFEEVDNEINLSREGVELSVSKTYATKQALDDIEIGGRNLYIESDAVDGFLHSNGSGSIQAAGAVTKEKTSGFISVTQGEEIKFQLWVTTPADSYVWYGYQFFKADQTVLDTNRPASHEYEMTGGSFHATWKTPIVVPEGAAYIRVSARMFDDGKIKIEKGTKVTDWTPAPEDVTDDIKEVNNNLSAIVEETETSLKLLKDSISTLVTDGNGESLMTQTSTGWTFSTKTIQETVEATSSELDNLSKSFDSTDALVNELGKTLADVADRTRYVKVGEYNNNGTIEACIELGDSKSNYKLLICQTQILFTVGSDIPTRIDIDGLVTDNITVENELRQINNNVSGRYVSAVRNNGNCGFQWKGDDV